MTIDEITTKVENYGTTAEGRLSAEELNTIVEQVKANRTALLQPTDNIKDGAVTEDKLADFTVTGQKIADGAVVASKMAQGAVTSEAMADALKALQWKEVNYNDIDALAEQPPLSAMGAYKVMVDKAICGYLLMTADSGANQLTQYFITSLVKSPL